MADAGGALEQQQGIAAKIPYQNIELGNPADKFLSAWAVATQLKQKQSEITGRMQALTDRNSQLEFMDRLRERQGEQKSYLDAARYQLAVQNSDNRALKDAADVSIATRRADTAEERVSNYADRKQRQEDANYRVMSAIGQLENEGIPKTDPRFMGELTKRVGRELGVADNAVINMVKSNAGKDVNANRTHMLREYELRDKTFWNDTGRRLYDSPTNTSPEPFLHPELLEREMTDLSWGDRFHGKSPQPTGKYVVKHNDPVTGSEIKRTFTLKELNDMKKEYLANEQFRHGIPDPVNMPELSVYDTPASTIREQAKRAATDPNAPARTKANAEKWLRENPE